MKRTILLFVCVLSLFSIAFAQTKTIKGTVTSESDGSPIPGVSVVVKGTTIGTVTNFEGEYEVKVPDIEQVLVFNFMGMKTEEISVTGFVHNVIMKENAIGVDEVVVTAIGIKRETKALGYAVQTVDNAELTRVSNADLTGALSGKAAGLQVTSSSGMAGAASYVTIRGASSITGNNQPLYVVDGMPISSRGSQFDDVDAIANSAGTAELNPEEIESISVLKGGAATALYGLQAANGAIIITTKKGKSSGKAQINFSSSVTLETVSQLPPRQNLFGQGANGVWESGNSLSWGPKLSESAYSKDPSVWLSPEYDVAGAIVSKDSELADASLGAVTPFDAYDIFQTGITYNNNLSISKGTDKGQYFVSLGYYNQEGIVPNNTFDKINIRANTSSKLNDNLEVGTNMSYVNTKGNYIQGGSNVSGLMLGLLRSPASFDNSAGHKLIDGSQRTYRHGGGYDNPYWVVNEISYEQIVDRFIGSAFLKWDPSKWFNLTYNVGTDVYMKRYQDYLPTNSRGAVNGYVEEYMKNNRVVNSDLLLNFQKEFSPIFNSRLTLGQNLYSTYYKSLTGKANGIEIPGFIQLSNTSGQTTNSDTYNYRTAALFIDASVDLYNKLYLGFSARQDWSTTMPEDNLSAFYPSASVGYVFTEHDIFKNQSILSFGKLRSSYAITANIAKPYKTQSYYKKASSGDGWSNGLTFPLMGNAGFTWDDTIGNSELKHESQETIEVGADLKFLNNRIGLDVGYFKNTNSDLLLSVPVANSTGYAYSYQNAASMESKGVEIVLSLSPIRSRDLNWDIVANFSKIDNVVTELANGVDNVFLGGFTDPQIRAVAGEDYRSIYGYDWVRDSKGTVVISDGSNGGRKGFPMTDGSRMVGLGSVNPDWNMNISNSLSYKGLNFSFLIDIKHGGKMYNGTRFTMNYFGTSGETSKREAYYDENGDLDFSKTPGENIVVHQGVVGHVDGDGNVITTGEVNTEKVVNDQAWYTGEGGNFGGGPTVAAIDDSNWFRLREVSLSYDFSLALMQSIGLSKLQVYVSGKNLYLKTPYKGVDPETSLMGASNAQGFDYFNMPGSKSVTFGMRVGF